MVRLRDERGLTLVELLAVIVILGIIAAIAVPVFTNTINKQKDKAILADASQIISAAKIAYPAGECNDANPDTCSDTELASYIGSITGTFSATKGADGWEVTYEKLQESDFKTDQVKHALFVKQPVAVTNQTISEKRLYQVMEQ